MHRRTLIIACLVTAVIGGCDGPMTPPDSGAIPVFDSGPPPPPTGELDLLFVVDNSGTMTEEQAALTRELPEMMRAITEGDLDVDGTPESQPFDSVRVGAITSDMGVGGFTVPNCDVASFLALLR